MYTIITVGNYSFDQFAWSPDGTKLAFVNYDSRVENLDVVNLVTNTTSQLTSANFISALTWLPDGTAVVFFDQKRIMAVNLDGSESIILDKAPGDIKFISWQPTKAVPEFGSFSMIVLIIGITAIFSLRKISNKK